MASAAQARSFDGRGRSFTEHEIAKLLEAHRDQESGRLRFHEADFEGATFLGPISFANAAFGTARFVGATFEGPADFEGARFLGDARFDSTTFEGTVSFRYARFDAAVKFELLADEPGTSARREEVVFRRWADFRDSRFAGDAGFGGAQFEGRARFQGALFESDVSFEGATFSRARTIGPVEVEGTLNLDRATFEAPVGIAVTARFLSCAGAVFRGRTTIEVSGEALTLEDAEFVEPSMVAGQSRELVRLESLRRANVANVTLANFNLSGCSLLGTHNLDRLRIEASDFLLSAGWWSTRRQVVFDELQFREYGRGPAISADRVADVYRSLRKGREDNKDEPGSADFYFGEMEMRRRGSAGFERAILTLYWLVSGYGLRASRAVAALAITVALFAVGFSELSGFDPDQRFWKSLLFSAESTSSLFRAPGPPEGAELNDEGHVLQMGLRILGPLFIGLALLALRARVKR
jgi:uncharacterized protein YjbI with pentapeptide repeats